MATTEDVLKQIVINLAEPRELEILGIDHEYDMALLKAKDADEYTTLHIDFVDDSQIDKRTGKPKIIIDTGWSEPQSDFGEAVETFYYARYEASMVTVYVDDTPELKLIQGGKDGGGNDE